MCNDYSAHPWAVDVEVHFTDGDGSCTDLTDADLDTYQDAIKDALKGDCYICIEDGMISFWADDADVKKLTAILEELEWHGCWLDYPDWYYINEVDYPEWTTTL